MSTTLEATVVDPAAFRAVLAAPSEKLAVVLIDPGQAEGLAQVLTTIVELRQNGLALRAVVFGDSSAVLPSAAGAGFLETWARPLLPAVLSSADVVVDLTDAPVSNSKAPVVRDASGLRSLFRGTKQLVLENEWGIGDELLLSAVAREIVRAHPDAEVWIRSRRGFRFPSFVRRDPPPSEARRIETIYQNAALYGPEAHSPFPGHLVQQMLDKVALDSGIRVQARDVRPELEIRAVFKTTEPSVLLHTRTNPRLRSKDWGLSRWVRLGELLRKAGVSLRQVGDKDEPLLEGAEDLRGTPVGDLPEIFAESWVVVCVVGFLMHLAEAARTPAVVIYGGREHPAIDGYPDQVHLSSGPLACRGRWGCHLAPDLDCPNGMACMDGLTPELVAREVLAALGKVGGA